jgi:hypothetical protein
LRAIASVIEHAPQEDPWMVAPTLLAELQSELGSQLLILGFGAPWNGKGIYCSKAVIAASAAASR